MLCGELPLKFRNSISGEKWFLHTKQDRSPVARNARCSDLPNFQKREESSASEANSLALNSCAAYDSGQYVRPEGNICPLFRSFTNKTQLFGPIAAQMRTKLLPDCHHQGSFAHNNS